MGSKKSRLSVVLTILVVLSIMLSNVIGLLNPFNRSQVNAAGEAYVGTASYSAEGSNIQNVATGETYHGFCIDSHKTGWSDENTFVEVDVNSVVDINALLHSPTTNSTIIQDLIKCIYYGYPYDAAGLQEQYNMSDSDFRYQTQKAIWYYTDNSNIDNLKVTQALVAMPNDLPTDVNFTPHFLKCDQEKIQNGMALYISDVPTKNITFEKTDVSGDILGDITLTLSYESDYANTIGVDSLANVTVTANGAPISSYNADTNSITFTTVAGVTLGINNIPVGKYTLKEEASNTYIASGIKYFRVMNDGTVCEVQGDGCVDQGVDNTDSLLSLVNVKQDQLTSVKFNKVSDEGDYLSGAKFILSTVDSEAFLCFGEISVSGVSNASKIDEKSGEYVIYTLKNQITIDNILVGYTYCLTEDDAPDDYVIENKYTYFKVLEDGTVLVGGTNDKGVIPTLSESTNKEVTVVNKPHVVLTPEFKLNKVDSDNNFLPGVTFTIVPDGNDAEAEFNNLVVEGAASVDYDFTNNVITFVTSDQQIKVTGMGRNITTSDKYDYILTEVSAPTNYQKTQTQYTFYFNKYGELRVGTRTSTSANFMYDGYIHEDITIVNKSLYSVTFEKVDGQGNLLPGALFQISTYVSGSSTNFDLITIEGATIESSGANYIQFRTGSEPITINNLQPYAYKLTEIQAAPGYVKLSNPYVFEPQTDGTVRVGEKTPDSGTYPSMTTEDKITITNLAFVNLDLNKIDFDNSNLKLTGAKFTLRPYDANAISAFNSIGAEGVSGTTYNYSDKFLSFTMDSSTVQLKNLVAGGVYVIQEDSAPENYALDSSKYYFSVSQTGEISVGVVPASSTSTSAPALSPVTGTSLDITNQKYVSAEFIKMDEDTLERIPGVTFSLKLVGTTGLEDFKNIKIQGGTELLRYDNDGEIIFETGSGEMHFTGLLRNTNYVLEEIEGPENYELPRYKTFFKVDANGAVYTASRLMSSTLTSVPSYNQAPVEAVGITNNKLESVEINKVNEDGDFVPGTKFELYSIKTAAWENINSIEIDGATNVVINESAHTVTFETTDAGFKINGLVDGVEYRLRETESATGYLNPDYDYFIKVTNGVVQYQRQNKNTSSSSSGWITTTANINIVNHKPLEVPFSKVDTNGDLVSGATFTITPYGTISNEDFVRILVEGAESVDYDNVNQVVTFVTGDSDITFKGIVPGNTYRIDEVSAPKGYFATSDIYLFATTNRAELLLAVTDETSLAAGDPTLDPDSKIEVVNTHFPKLYSMSLTKVDQYDRMVEDVQFAVMPMGAQDPEIYETMIEISGAKSVDYTSDWTFVTGKSAITIDGLEANEIYALVELDAPEDYDFDTNNAWCFYFDDEGNMYATIATPTTYSDLTKYSKIDGAKVTVVNDYTGDDVPTPVPTPTPTGTPTGVPTGVPTLTPSPTPSVTPSVTPSATPSVTPSATPSPTPSNSVATPTPTGSGTVSGSGSHSSSGSVSTGEGTSILSIVACLLLLMACAAGAVRYAPFRKE